MNPLIQFSAHPMAQGMVHALGWTLLHFCWQGAFVAGLLWCVLSLLGARASRARYAASCSALVLLMAAPLMTFARLASAEYQLVQNSAGDRVIAPGMILWVGLDEPAASWPMRAVAAVDHWMPWVLAAWFAGVLFYVCRLNLGLLAAHRMKSRDTQPVNEELQRTFRRLQQRLGVVRAVKLMHSARVQVPTVIGWLRPVVLIPVSCLTGLSTEQVEAIFCHELAHVRRHDYLVSVFQSVVEALLFYHPAVWWVSQQVRHERECCCDELAVGAGGDVLAYARALSFLEERRACEPEFVLGANGGVLTMRIKRLLRRKEDAAGSPLAAAAVLALIAALAGTYSMTAARAQATSSDALAADRSGVQVPALSEGDAVGVAGKSDPVVLAARLMAPVSYRPQSDAPNANGGEDVATPSARPIRISGGVMASNILSRVTPVYPPDAKAAHVQGAVVLHAIISKTGDVQNLQVISGAPPLAASALDAVRQWKYKPYLLNGEPREVETTITVNYTLEETPKQDDPAALPDAGATPPTSGNALHVSPGVIAGNLIKPVPPVYPQEAKEAKIEGAVVLHAVISRDGDVEDLRVISGPPELTHSALDAVKQWKYKPYLLNGEPTEVETNITVNYTLGNSAKENPETSEVYNPGQALRRIGGGVSAPILTYQRPPEFSDAAKAAKFSGVVVVRLIVDTHGLPQNVHVVRGVGMGLDEKAVEAVERYRFKPSMEKGQPVPASVNIEVNFGYF